MTQSFAVDQNNDLFIGPNGSLAINSGLAAVSQNAAHAAKTILGEMVLATDKGIPYFEAVWTGSPNLPQFEAALRAAILAVDGVTKVDALTITQTGNTLNYAADIVTVYGSGVVNG